MKEAILMSYESDKSETAGLRSNRSALPYHQQREGLFMDVSLMEVPCHPSHIAHPAMDFLPHTTLLQRRA
jgi:hypothetical protein